VVGVSRGGDLYVREDRRLSEAQRRALSDALGRSTSDRALGDRDATLNLNHPVLREARLARRNPGRTVTVEERARRAAELLDQPTRPPFVSARVAWLLRQLGVGR